MDKLKLGFLLKKFGDGFSIVSGEYAGEYNIKLANNKINEIKLYDEVEYYAKLFYWVGQYLKHKDKHVIDVPNYVNTPFSYKFLQTVDSTINNDDDIYDIFRNNQMVLDKFIEKTSSLNKIVYDDKGRVQSTYIPGLFMIELKNKTYWLGGELFE